MQLAAGSLRCRAATAAARGGIDGSGAWFMLCCPLQLPPASAPAYAQRVAGSAPPAAAFDPLAGRRRRRRRARAAAAAAARPRGRGAAAAAARRDGRHCGRGRSRCSCRSPSRSSSRRRRRRRRAARAADGPPPDTPRADDDEVMSAPAGAALSARPASCRCRRCRDAYLGQRRGGRVRAGRPLRRPEADEPRAAEAVQATPRRTRRSRRMIGGRG